MRQSRLLCRTLREPPADIEWPGLQFAARAGIVHPAGAGLHTWPPLGQRVLARLARLAHAAAESLGGQAMNLPALYLADRPTPDQFSLHDRAGRQYALDDGNGATWLRALQNDIVSYRQLPTVVYRVRELFRDEERPRGLLRARERLTLAVLSLHANLADLEAFYPRALDALAGVLRQGALDVWLVPTHAGHVLALPHPAGDEIAFACRACDYRATSDEARFVKLAAAPGGIAAPVQPVATPNCHTIADVAAFLNVPTTQTLKTMMYADDENRVLLAVIRGDLDINVVKLEHAAHHTRLSTGPLRPATDAQIRAAGAVPGYASPVGLSGVTVIADDSVQSAVGMVAGANQEGYHLTGVSIPRDFTPTVVADIAQARSGSACPACHGQLDAANVIELGHCTRLGTELSQALEVTCLDAAGKACPPAVGSYELNLSRLIAAVLETHHDERGLLWPAALAPFDVHLIVLGKEPREQAETLYAQLEQAGLSVLYDDRDESPGVKFADADLIGLPTRLTVSKRGLDKGSVEIKPRASAEARLVAVGDILPALRGL